MSGEPVPISVTEDEIIAGVKAALKNAREQGAVVRGYSVVLSATRKGRACSFSERRAVDYLLHYGALMAHAGRFRERLGTRDLGDPEPGAA